MSLFGKKEEKGVSEADLKRGLKKQEFVFYYQPEFDLKTEQVVAVEALMRWNAPDRIIPPNEFIPVLEQSGLITDFTEYLLHQTLTDLKAIKDAGYPDVIMTVNLSTSQLKDETLISKIKKNLEETQTSVQCLECEITESQQLDLPAMKETIFKELADLGVAISLDDFGTGYSSFDYLRHLDFKKIKIDGSFVQSLGENAKDKAILSEIIQFSHALKIPVLAEGIETTEQKEWLEKNGCEYGQGFWFSRPLPLDQLLIFLKNKKEN